MSLVDYASSCSSEDDDDVVLEEKEKGPVERQSNEEREITEESSESKPSPPQKRQSTSASASEEQRKSAAPVLPSPFTGKLPDAFLLLSTPSTSSTLSSANDHASRVAAARAESAVRKRDHALSSAGPRNKVPRGNLPPLRNVPDTVSGLLVPPQLSGRSNVVTEDISKLFVRRHAEPSSQ